MSDEMVQEISQETIVQARNAVAQAKSRLMVNQPFYGYFLQHFDIQANADIATMAVGFHRGRIRCVYHPCFVTQITIDELQAVLIHEVLHVVLQHLTRRGDRHPFAFNVACDMAINPKIQGLPDGCVMPQSGWGESNAEYYYDLLLREKGVKLIHQYELIDDHSLWQEAEDHGWECDHAIAKAVQDTCQKSQGNLPGEIRDELNWWLTQHQVSWRTVLREFVRTHAPADRNTTYTRRNRRHDIFGLPGRRKTFRPHVVVAVDTSGSVSEVELNLLFSEIEGLAQEVNPTLLLFHSEVYTIQPYLKGDFRKLGQKIEWGGTDFHPIFKCVEKGDKATDGTQLAQEADCLVILTDGFATYPSQAQVPVLWVYTPHHSREIPPFGKCITLQEKTKISESF